MFRKPSLINLAFYYFLSSRRRHTRCSRDWSSDVCSSDLELGLSAIFHDIGKADVPLEILNKPSEFTEEEWKIMRRHPILGVKHLIKLKGLDDLAMKIIIGGFEHHLNYDLSGYPKLNTKRNLTLFGRIISLVDCYDALTSSRVYN